MRKAISDFTFEQEEANTRDIRNGTVFKEPDLRNMIAFKWKLLKPINQFKLEVEKEFYKRWYENIGDDGI